MKKMVAGLVVIAIVGLVIFLVLKGVIRWQPLTMLVAALAAPFKFIMSLFGSEEDIRRRHEEKRAQEQEWQRQMENRVREREERVAVLQGEIETLSSRIAELKAENEAIASQIKSMSVEEKQKLGKKLLGD